MVADNSLMAEILRGQGAIMERLDALEKLICEAEAEDESEDKSEASEIHESSGIPTGLGPIF